MKKGITAIAVAGAFCAGVFYSSVRAYQAGPAKSTQSGVYTEEQGKRGAAVYAAECASCHGATLEGGEMAPPLAGAAFMSNWQGLTAGDLFERIRISMPDGNPGKLSRQQNADVVAYIFSVGKAPAGKEELPRELELLKQITIDAPK